MPAESKQGFACTVNSDKTSSSRETGPAKFGSSTNRITTAAKRKSHMQHLQISEIPLHLADLWGRNAAPARKKSLSVLLSVCGITGGATLLARHRLLLSDTSDMFWATGDDPERGGVGYPGTKVLTSRMISHRRPCPSTSSNPPNNRALHMLPFSTRRFRLPWTQITDLTTHLHLGNSFDLLDILQSTPNLTTLAFSIFTIVYPQEMSHEVPPSRALQLLHLRKLSCIIYDFVFSSFFDFVTAPNLSEFSLECDEGDRHFEVMQRFLHRSRCTITSATLNMTSSNQVSSFLNILPDVEVLKLHDVTCDGELMRALAFDESTTSWGQKLKKIVMDTGPIRKEMHEAFVSMLQSRLRVPANLDPAVGVTGRGRRLESFQLEVSGARSHGWRAVLKVLEERLSPEEMTMVTFKVGEVP